MDNKIAVEIKSPFEFTLSWANRLARKEEVLFRNLLASTGAAPLPRVWLEMAEACYSTPSTVLLLTLARQQLLCVRSSWSCRPTVIATSLSTVLLTKSHDSRRQRSMTAQFSGWRLNRFLVLLVTNTHRADAFPNFKRMFVPAYTRCYIRRLQHTVTVCLASAAVRRCVADSAVRCSCKNQYQRVCLTAGIIRLFSATPVFRLQF